MLKLFLKVIFLILYLFREVSVRGSLSFVGKPWPCSHSSTYFSGSCLVQPHFAGHWETSLEWFGLRQLYHNISQNFVVVEIIGYPCKSCLLCHPCHYSHHVSTYIVLLMVSCVVVHLHYRYGAVFLWVVVIDHCSVIHRVRLALSLSQFSWHCSGVWFLTTWLVIWASRHMLN